MVKFLKKGIKVDGVYFPVGYMLIENSRHGGTNVMIYFKHSYYINEQVKASLKESGLIAENLSDSMTDYFENSHIRVYPDNKFYNQVLALTNQAKVGA